MSNLDAVVALDQDERGLFHAHIGDEWMQGRTAYGGISAAIALQAALDAEPGPQPLKCAQISFVGPVSGGVALGILGGPAMFLLFAGFALMGMVLFLGGTRER